MGRKPRIRKERKLAAMKRLELERLEMEEKLKKMEEKLKKIEKAKKKADEKARKTKPVAGTSESLPTFKLCSSSAAVTEATCAATYEDDDDIDQVLWEMPPIPAALPMSESLPDVLDQEITLATSDNVVKAIKLLVKLESVRSEVEECMASFSTIALPSDKPEVVISEKIQVTSACIKDMLNNMETKVEDVRTAAACFNKEGTQITSALNRRTLTPWLVVNGSVAQFSKKLEAFAAGLQSALTQPHLLPTMETIPCVAPPTPPTPHSDIMLPTTVFPNQLAAAHPAALTQADPTPFALAAVPKADEEGAAAAVEVPQAAGENSMPALKIEILENTTPVDVCLSKHEEMRKHVQMTDNSEVKGTTEKVNLDFELVECPAIVIDPRAYSLRTVVSDSAITQEARSQVVGKDEAKELCSSLSSPADVVEVETTKVVDIVPASCTAVSKKKTKNRKNKGDKTAGNAKVVVGGSAAVQVDLVAPGAETLSPFAACKVDDKVLAIESDSQTTNVVGNDHKENGASKNKNKKSKGKGPASQTATNLQLMTPVTIKQDPPSAEHKAAEQALLLTPDHGAVGNDDIGTKYSVSKKKKNGGGLVIPTPINTKVVGTQTTAPIITSHPTSNTSKDGKVAHGDMGSQNNKSKNNAKKGDSSGPAAQPAAVQPQHSTSNVKNVVKGQTPAADMQSKVGEQQSSSYTSMVQQQPHKQVPEQATKQQQKHQSVQGKAQRPVVHTNATVAPTAFAPQGSAKSKGQKVGHVSSSAGSSKHSPQQCKAAAAANNVLCQDKLVPNWVLGDGSCFFGSVAGAMQHQPSHIRQALGLPAVSRDIKEDTAALRSKLADTIETDSVCRGKVMEMFGNCVMAEAAGCLEDFDKHDGLVPMSYNAPFCEGLAYFLKEVRRPDCYVGQIEKETMELMLERVGYKLEVLTRGKQSYREQMQPKLHLMAANTLATTKYVLLENQGSTHYEYLKLGSVGVIPGLQLQAYVSQDGWVVV